MTLGEFKEKLEEYATNNISAFLGKVQITEMEKTDLLQMYGQLSAPDQQEATKLLKGKGVDALR